MPRPNARSRSYQPAVDRLETICLLTAGIKPSAMVHTLAVVDLKTTPIGNDFLRTLRESTPQSSRQKIVVNKLTGDNVKNTVAGSATGIYKVSVIGTIKATIAFKTNVNNPKNKDVQVSVDRFSSFLTSSTKLKVQKAVVSFVQRNRDQILAALHPTTA